MAIVPPSAITWIVPPVAKALFGAAPLDADATNPLKPPVSVALMVPLLVASRSIVPPLTAPPPLSALGRWALASTKKDPAVIVPPSAVRSTLPPVAVPALNVADETKLPPAA